MYFYLLFSHISDPLYLLLFLCTSWSPFPVVTVRLPVAFGLGAAADVQSLLEFPWVVSSLQVSFSYVPPSLVRQLGIFFLVPMHGVLIRIWSLLEVAAVGVYPASCQDCVWQGDWHI